VEIATRPSYKGSLAWNIVVSEMAISLEVCFHWLASKKSPTISVMVGSVSAFFFLLLLELLKMAYQETKIIHTEPGNIIHIVLTKSWLA